MGFMKTEIFICGFTSGKDRRKSRHDAILERFFTFVRAFVCEYLTIFPYCSANTDRMLHGMRLFSRRVILRNSVNRAPWYATSGYEYHTAERKQAEKRISAPWYAISSYECHTAERKQAEKRISAPRYATSSYEYHTAESKQAEKRISAPRYASTTSENHTAERK